MHVFIRLMDGAAVRRRKRAIGRAVRMIVVVFVVVHRITRYWPVSIAVTV
jgi:hypothetical protein